MAQEALISHYFRNGVDDSLYNTVAAHHPAFYVKEYDDVGPDSTHLEGHRIVYMSRCL